MNIHLPSGLKNCGVLGDAYRLTVYRQVNHIIITSNAG